MENISEELTRLGYHSRGWETMYNGHTGRQMQVWGSVLCTLPDWYRLIELLEQPSLPKVSVVAQLCWQIMYALLAGVHSEQVQRSWAESQQGCSSRLAAVQAQSARPCSFISHSLQLIISITCGSSFQAISQHPG